jgi:uncharacterized protein YodC (DUF2158 family)
MENLALKIGDIVVLKSGGPNMLVRGVYPLSGEVECAWVSENESEARFFKTVTLKMVKP